MSDHHFGFEVLSLFSFFLFFCLFHFYFVFYDAYTPYIALEFCWFVCCLLCLWSARLKVRFLGKVRACLRQ